MRYDNSYKIAGRPAEYYLTPKAIRLLRDSNENKSIDDKTIKNSYNDKEKSSDEFIKRCLKIFAIANRLKMTYPFLKFITKREFTLFTYLPKPLPDAYIALEAQESTQRFFMELFEEGTPAFLINRRLRQYIEYHENKSWDVTNSLFPVILFICETAAQEKQLVRLANGALERYGDGFPIYTTTYRALVSANSGEIIWSSSDAPEKLQNLTSISTSYN